MDWYFWWWLNSRLTGNRVRIKTINAHTLHLKIKWRIWFVIIFVFTHLFRVFSSINNGRSTECCAVCGTRLVVAHALHVVHGHCSTVTDKSKAVQNDYGKNCDNASNDVPHTSILLLVVAYAGTVRSRQQ